MIRRQSKTQVEANIRTIQSRLRQFMRVSLSSAAAPPIA
jgi:hypothetical protein